MDSQTNDTTAHLDVSADREVFSYGIWCVRLLLWLGIFGSAVLFWWAVGLVVLRLIR
jgi:hypothetical protein